MHSTLPSQTPGIAYSHADWLVDPVRELRDATRALHERLDRGLPLARDDASLRDYLQHLRILRDWQTALTPWLARTGCDFSGLALIAQDLAYGAAEAAEAVGWPGVDAVDPVDPVEMHQADDGSEAFCWGATYVLEGSRLGGEVLYRRLHQRLAPHPLRYLHQRFQGGTAWPETLAALRQKLSSPTACQSGCRGAVAAFEVLLKRFETTGCLR